MEKETPRGDFVKKRNFTLSVHVEGMRGRNGGEIADEGVRRKSVKRGWGRTRLGLTKPRLQTKHQQS